MKLTKSQLKEIIREELLNEDTKLHIDGIKSDLKKIENDVKQSYNFLKKFEKSNDDRDLTRVAKMLQDIQQMWTKQGLDSIAKLRSTI